MQRYNTCKKIKEKIDSDAFFGGRYVGKVIEIDSSTRGEETEENIQKLLTIEQNTNPVEIVLHVYKLKEGWDVNNLFTIIPLNAAKSDILALQTKGIEQDHSEWRPFQIAFILLNIKGLIDPESDERNIVDLLYFPRVSNYSP